MKNNWKITIPSMLSMFKQKLYCLFTLFVIVYHYTCCSSDYYSKLLACFNVLQVKAQPTSDTSDAPCKVRSHRAHLAPALQGPTYPGGPVSSRSTLQVIGIGWMCWQRVWSTASASGDFHCFSLFQLSFSCRQSFLFSFLVSSSRM